MLAGTLVGTDTGVVVGCPDGLRAGVEAGVLAGTDTGVAELKKYFQIFNDQQMFADLIMDFDPSPLPSFLEQEQLLD